MSEGRTTRAASSRDLLLLVLAAVCGAAKKQRESLKPPMTVEQYLASLQRQGLAQTVVALRQFADLI